MGLWVCEYCVGGWETLCLSQRNTGYTIDGSYADYAVASARFVVPVPAGIDPFDAAPLTCAGVTTYKAVKVSGARPSDLVAVFGIGGFGHMAVQYALISGARVAAVDLPRAARHRRRAGSRHPRQRHESDPAAVIGEYGGVDAAIITAATPPRSSRRTAA